VAIAFAREGADLLCSYWKEDEDAQRGIRVNAVAPGPIWTPLVIMSFAAESRYISGEVIGATGGKPLH
jgi:NAD(P)-dependent dehydrogenase (short-subunit alcohol dehydrogenase family)